MAMDQMLALVPSQTGPVVLFDYKETTTAKTDVTYSHASFMLHILNSTNGLTGSAQCRTELFPSRDRVSGRARIKIVLFYCRNYNSRTWCVYDTPFRGLNIISAIS